MSILLFNLGFFGVLIKLVVVGSLAGMYVYAKLAPHKDRLDPKHRKWFDTADSIFGYLSRAIGKNMKPYQVGEGIFLDMGQMVLFFIICAIALFTMMGL
ncbi:MAG: hypothetical protein RLZZ165_920 [Bacteroidota bacterium]|jgi:hypothetical protein